MATPLLQYPPVFVPNSETRQLKSAAIGQNYLVKVRLPEDYHTSSNLSPVLYLLDGDHAFGMATDIVQYLIYGGNVPDLIVVSPTYGSKTYPKEGGWNMRERDLLPFPMPEARQEPGAAQYLDFLEKELIPFIEKNYRVVPSDRTLWGYSYGAIFGMYALFQRPGLFHRCILVDGFDPRLNDMEKVFAVKYHNLPVRLHVTAPSGPEGDEMERLVEVMKGRHYTSFEAAVERLNVAGHAAIPADGLTRGLVSVFHK